MNPSRLLQKFLSTGNKPANQRESAALLDESRSLLVSQLPPTAVHIQNLTQGNIDCLTAGGKDGMLDRAVAIHRAQNLSAPRPSRPAAKARPTASVKPSPARPASKPATIHRATATATKPATPATPATSAPLATVSAKEFAKPDQSMTLAEFNKMKPAEKMRFVKSGGKIV
jgi:hypothetical protein